MKRRLSISLVLILFGMTFVAFRATGEMSAPPNTEDSGYFNIAVLTRAMQLIRQDYVDERKTSYRALTYAALKGMFDSLDPHSSFMEPRELKRMTDDTRSEFTGLGITVTTREGMLTIVAPMEDTPSFRAGLLPGDQILKINGESTERLDLNAALERLSGEVGEKVMLTILRPATKEIKEVELSRATIKIESVKDARLFPAEETGGARIGYVRLTQFSEPTAKDLEAKLDKLEKEGMEGLILDLRNNPGGLLNSAVEVCSFFVPPGTMVVYTEGRVPSQRQDYKTPARSKPRPNYPLAVLVNGGSASASEIVAGALKDLKRAVLVGETTFGKGSVQSVVGLQDGSGARMTTARYYTPSKQVIHEKGVAPQIRATLTPQQERLLSLSRLDYLEEEDARAVAAFKDPQLERAIDALKGAVLYAGLEKKAAETLRPAPAHKR